VGATERRTRCDFRLEFTTVFLKMLPWSQVSEPLDWGASNLSKVDVDGSSPSKEA
jgi:hypothetical protein